MADATDLLLTVYGEHMEQARWHEAQRERVATLVVAGSSALLALTGAATPMARIVALTLVIILGLVGTAIALKHYERNRTHVRIGRNLRQRLDELLPEAGISGHLHPAAPHESRACRIIKPVRLYVLWLLLTGFVSVMGALLLAVTFMTR